MEDKTIIDLYFRRSERAISETAAKYGAYCGVIAANILPSAEDREECLNDAWLAAWNDIPPSRPDCLKAYLGRLVRNLAITRWRYAHAGKRDNGLEVLLSELEDCIPDRTDPETRLEQAELSRILRDWLDCLEPEERRLFVRRYWYGIPVRTLAEEAGIAQNSMTKRLLHLRKKLKTRLEEEGEYL